MTLAKCGTNSAHVSGCRCPECNAAHAAYQRDYRLSAKRHHLPRPVGPTLAVNCWCEAKVVQVAVKDVWDGVTDTCGAAECRPPASEVA